MKAETTPESIAETAASILEEAAFFFVMPLEDPPPFSETVVESSIVVEDAASSRLVIACGMSLARELAANLLGLDPGDDEAETSGPQALAEILNIYAGALMERWYGAENPPKIGIPSTRTHGPSDYVQGLQSAAVAAHLVTEDGARIDLAVFEGAER